MSDAKFESGTFSTFGDMTSQGFLLKKGTSHRIRYKKYLPSENRFNSKKMSFFVHNRSSRHKIDPHVNLSNFQGKGKFFHFQNFLDVSMRKEQQQPPFEWQLRIWSSGPDRVKHHRALI